MTNITLNHLISGIISDIIKEYCFIVTPYFQPWKQLQKILELAASDEKKLFFLFRDNQRNNPDVLALNSYFGFDVFFINSLHAKIYINEKQALISSMNLFDYSKENNFETGYQITSSFECKTITTNVILGELLKTWVDDKLYGRYSDMIENGLFNILNKKM